MEEFKENYLLWVIFALVAVLAVKVIFTKQEADGTLSFGMPKLAKKTEAYRGR